MGSSWSIETIDTANAGTSNSIALDSNDRTHISYRSSFDMKYARWTGATWNIQTLDSEGDVGKHTSLALDSNGAPHISYFAFTGGSHQILRYARWTGSVWDFQAVDSNESVGTYTSIVLDNRDAPHTSYYDFGNGDLKYAKGPARRDDDLLGTWDSGVWYRNSLTDAWVNITTSADSIAGGNLDGDVISDLVGVWSS